MKSPRSTLSASRGRVPHFDPAVVLLPIFIGFLRAAPYPIFFAMFLGPQFGLSNGHQAPNGWALALIGAIALWSVRIVPRIARNLIDTNILYMAIGIACWMGWMALEPGWHLGEVLRNPILMVNGQGQFGWTFAITLLFWVFALRLAMDEREQSPEGVRGIMARSLVAVLAGVVIAALVPGEMSSAGLSAAYIALPVALVAGIGAVGMSEMISTRAAARKRGVTVPGWGRWGRTFVGVTIVVLVVTFVAGLVFGPAFLQLAIETIATIWRGVATVLLWIIYGIVYGLFWIARALVWLFNALFHTTLTPPEVPDMGEQPPPGNLEMPEQGDIEPWKYASLLRFGGILALVVIGFLILSRFVRFRASPRDSDLDEERSSVFSGSLLRNQLRNLFGRKSYEDKPRKLNLSDDPSSVRETMLYLQVLAARMEMPKRDHESAIDFTSRLASEWPDVGAEIREINNRYERVRYGETEEDKVAAIAAWRAIWAYASSVPEP